MRISLAVPHTPWISERAEHMQSLRPILRKGADHYLELTERAPNAVWSEQMWRWLLETDADWCLTLQDDVELAPGFWRILRVMLEVLDGQKVSVCGLSSVHPIQVEMARQGHRWYRTASWLVGWAYAIRREALETFLAWRAITPDAIRTPQNPAGLTEDTLLNHWISRNTHTWHPVPTIVDHNTMLTSMYGNDEHVHRRPWITWRDFTTEALCDPTFWRPNGPSESVPLLPTPAPHICWACNTRVGIVGAGPIRLCPSCVAQAASVLITRGGHG